MLHEAFYVATTGRPGPVVVDIPKDVQFATGTYYGPRKSPTATPPTGRATKGDADAIRNAVELMAGAEAADPLYRRRRHQFRAARRRALLRELVAATGFPITSTLMGLGAYPASGRNWLGMLGMHGTYEANMAMHDCDVMIVHRRALRRPHHRPHRRLLAGLAQDPHRHRPSSINKNIRVDVPIVGDVAQVLDDMLHRLSQGGGRQKASRHRRRGGRRSDAGAPADSLAYRPSERRDHAAIRHPAALSS